MSEWQPIKTAPKINGTEIWAYASEQVRMIYLVCGEDPLCDMWVYADDLLNDADPNPEQPTHWMPLPAPPGEAKP